MTNKKRIPLIIAGFLVLLGSSAFAAPYSLNTPPEPNVVDEPAGRVRHARDEGYGLVTPEAMTLRPAFATPRRTPAEKQLLARSIPVL